MQDAEVKNRLSLAFESTKDVIVTCRRIVTGSSIPSSKKEEILEDLRDITNIMRRRKYEDIEPIDEAINALNEQGSFFAHTVSLLILSARIYAHVRNISGEKELGECLKHLLEWLHYIKKTMMYHGGFVTGSLDGWTYNFGSGSTQQTSYSDYFYVDESGGFGQTDGYNADNDYYQWPSHSH